MWPLRTMGCYLALKRIDILTRAATRTNLEGIVPGEICLNKREASRTVPFIETGSRLRGIQGLREEGNGELVLNGDRDFVWEVAKVLKLMVVRLHNIVKACNATEFNATFMGCVFYQFS